MAVSGTKDLTRGKPMKLILGFALPLLFGVLFQQMYNFVDTAIVGKYLGTAKLGAVGSTGAVNFLIVGCSLGMCSGFSVPVSQRFGAGDLSEMRRYVMNAAYCAGVLGVLLGVVTAVLCPEILRLMNTQPAYFEDAVSYIRVIFAAIPVTMVYNMAAGILRALGDSKTPVLFLVMAAVVNVLLDLLFIIRFDMDVAGAAWATVISQLLSGIGCVTVLVKRFTVLRPDREERKVSRRHIRVLLGVGLPMGLQFSITAVGSVVLQVSVNGISEEAVAAITAGSKLSSLCSCVYDALSGTVAVYAGQNLGAGQYRRISTGLLDAAILGIIYSMMATLTLWLFAEPLVRLFVSADETAVIEMTVHYLRVNSSAYIPLMFVNIVRLTVQGMGYTRVAMISGALEMVARSAVALLLVPVYAFNAACFANPAAWIAADLFLFPCYFVTLRKAKRLGERGAITN